MTPPAVGDTFTEVRGTSPLARWEWICAQCGRRICNRPILARYCHSFIIAAHLGCRLDGSVAEQLCRNDIRMRIRSRALNWVLAWSVVLVCRVLFRTLRIQYLSGA